MSGGPIGDRRQATPATHLVGLIGERLTASLTPLLHETEAARLGLEYEYRILDLIEMGRSPRDLEHLLGEAADEGFDAVNVTYPCKQLAFDLVDDVDHDAGRLRAVNLVLLREGRRVGYNTDWIGYRDGLRAGLPDASMERVVQAGCGGAGSATAYALLACGTRELQLTDVDDARAEALADELRALFPSSRVTTVFASELDVALAAASGVVNATPLGMAHHPGVAFDVDRVRPGTWVSDVVYRPLQTELIRRAIRRGLPVLDGGRMAVGQAFASLEIITGVRPDRQRMEGHFRGLVREETSAEEERA
ncbi:shikimate dehydrogenase [Microbacterium sp. CPCC 204701]|uniref:shikimate dehydrogenase n=1 Tax=Microbacterium sp. CPCC 204701 TaxID=2493084 RepID=UPI000FDB8C0E|nr:shikimate dehydrogenase [Microbacterium sp. CPCC 204701]